MGLYCSRMIVKAMAGFVAVSITLGPMPLRSAYGLAPRSEVSTKSQQVDYAIASMNQALWQLHESLSQADGTKSQALRALVQERARLHRLRGDFDLVYDAVVAFERGLLVTYRIGDEVRVFLISSPQDPIGLEKRLILSWDLPLTVPLLAQQTAWWTHDDRSSKYTLLLGARTPAHDLDALIVAFLRLIEEGNNILRLKGEAERRLATIHPKDLNEVEREQYNNGRLAINRITYDEEFFQNYVLRAHAMILENRGIAIQKRTLRSIKDLLRDVQRYVKGFRDLSRSLELAGSLTLMTRPSGSKQAKAIPSSPAPTESSQSSAHRETGLAAEPIQEHPRYILIQRDGKTEQVLEERLRAREEIIQRLMALGLEDPSRTEGALILETRLDGNGHVRYFSGKVLHVSKNWNGQRVRLEFDPKTLFPRSAYRVGHEETVLTTRPVYVETQDGTSQGVDVSFTRAKLLHLLPYLDREGVRAVRVEGNPVQAGETAFRALGDMTPDSTRLPVGEPTISWVTSKGGNMLEIRTKLLADRDDEKAPSETRIAARPIPGIKGAQAASDVDRLEVEKALEAQGIPSNEVQKIIVGVTKRALATPEGRTLFLKLYRRAGGTELYPIRQLLLLPHAERAVEVFELLLDKYRLSKSLALQIALGIEFADYEAGDLKLLSQLAIAANTHGQPRLDRLNRARLSKLSQSHPTLLEYDAAQDVVDFKAYKTNGPPIKIDLNPQRRLTPVAMTTAEIALVKEWIAEKDLGRSQNVYYRFYDEEGNLLAAMGAREKGGADDRFELLLEYLLRGSDGAPRPIVVAGFPVHNFTLSAYTTHVRKSSISLKPSGLSKEGVGVQVFEKGYLGATLDTLTLEQRDWDTFLRIKKPGDTLHAFLQREKVLKNIPVHEQYPVMVDTTQGALPLATIHAYVGKWEHLFDFLRQAQGYPIEIPMPGKRQKMDFYFFKTAKVKKRYLFKADEPVRVRWRIVPHQGGLDSQLIRINPDGTKTAYIYRLALPTDITATNPFFQVRGNPLAQDSAMVETERIFTPEPEEAKFLLSALGQSGILSKREASRALRSLGSTSSSALAAAPPTDTRRHHLQTAPGIEGLGPAEVPSRFPKAFPDPFDGLAGRANADYRYAKKPAREGRGRTSPLRLKHTREIALRTMQRGRAYVEALEKLSRITATWKGAIDRIQPHWVASDYLEIFRDAAKEIRDYEFRKKEFLRIVLDAQISARRYLTNGDPENQQPALSRLLREVENMGKTFALMKGHGHSLHSMLSRLLEGLKIEGADIDQGAVESARSLLLAAEMASKHRELQETFDNRPYPEGAQGIYLLSETGRVLGVHDGSNLDPLLDALGYSLDKTGPLYVYGISLTTGAILARPSLHAKIPLKRHGFQGAERVVHQVRRGALGDIVPVTTVGVHRFERYLKERRTGESLQDYGRRRQVKKSFQAYKMIRRGGEDGAILASHHAGLPKKAALWTLLLKAHPQALHLEHYRKWDKAREFYFFPQTEYGKRYLDSQLENQTMHARLEVLRDGICIEIYPSREGVDYRARFVVPLDASLRAGVEHFETAAGTVKDALLRPGKNFFLRPNEETLFLKDLAAYGMVDPGVLTQYEAALQEKTQGDLLQERIDFLRSVKPLHRWALEDDFLFIFDRDQPLYMLQGYTDAAPLIRTIEGLFKKHPTLILMGVGLRGGILTTPFAVRTVLKTKGFASDARVTAIASRGQGGFYPIAVLDTPAFGEYLENYADKPLWQYLEEINPHAPRVIATRYSWVSEKGKRVLLDTAFTEAPSWTSLKRKIRQKGPGRILVEWKKTQARQGAIKLYGDRRPTKLGIRWSSTNVSLWADTETGMPDKDSLMVAVAPRFGVYDDPAVDALGVYPRSTPRDILPRSDPMFQGAA